MENQKEVQQQPVEVVVIADQETLQRSQQQDELQDKLDEKVADTLLNSDMEVDTSTAQSPEEAINEEIVQQTIDAEEVQETLDTRVLRDFDEGIITFDKGGVIRYINPSASLILGLEDNAVGKRYRDVFGRDNDALLEFLVKATAEKNGFKRWELLFYVVE